MVPEVTNIAIECLRRPHATSFWSPQLKKYVRNNTDEGRAAEQEVQTRAEHPPINPAFKFVFRWTFIGTLLFVGLCIGLSLVAGREAPPLLEKIILATFDLAKIGFGGVVGLLGGMQLQGKSADSYSS
jgi:hypothetical protein